MKNQIETVGKTPLIFYFALALPVIIIYLEYQVHQPPMIGLILKYGICFLFYLFCINLINNQKIAVTEKNLSLRIDSHFINIEKNITFGHIQKIEDHSIIPKIKVIKHAGKKTLVVNLFKNKNLFDEIKKERPDLFS